MFSKAFNRLLSLMRYSMLRCTLDVHPDYMESVMSASAMVAEKKVDTTRLGEYAAMQPVSGVTSVTSINETFAVNGIGRAAYVRIEKTAKDAQR